jgi:hypothetical protein
MYRQRNHLPSRVYGIRRTRTEDREPAWKGRLLEGKILEDKRKEGRMLEPRNTCYSRSQLLRTVLVRPAVFFVRWQDA